MPARCCSACDGEEAPAADGGRLDAGVDSGAAIEPSAPIGCAHPAHGAMVLEPDAGPYVVTASFRDLPEGVRVRIGGVEAEVDVSGLARASIDARFGLNDVLVESEGGQQLCSFVLAPRYLGPEDEAEPSSTLRLTARDIRHHGLHSRRPPPRTGSPCRGAYRRPLSA